MYADVFYTYSVSSSSGESPKVFWLYLESGYGSKGTCVFWRQFLQIIDLFLYEKLNKTSLLLYRYTLTPNTKDWSFMEMYIHVRDDMNQVLAFNPNTYGKFEPVRNIQPGT